VTTIQFTLQAAMTAPAAGLSRDEIWSAICAIGVRKLEIRQQAGADGTRIPCMGPVRGHGLKTVLAALAPYNQRLDELQRWDVAKRLKPAR
jgi:hypothetical protein